MATTGHVHVEVTGDTSQLEGDLKELELKAAIINTPSGSSAREAAYATQSRYYAQKAMDANRSYAALLSPLNPRRWFSLLRAKRYERELRG